MKCIVAGVAPLMMGLLLVGCGDEKELDHLKARNSELASRVSDLEKELSKLKEAESFQGALLALDRQDHDVALMYLKSVVTNQRSPLAPFANRYLKQVESTIEARRQEQARKEKEKKRRTQVLEINRQYEAALLSGDKQKISLLRPKWEAFHPTARKVSEDFGRGKEKGQACARSGTGSLGQIGAFPNHLVDNLVDKMYDQMSGGFGFRGESQDFRLGWKCGFMEANGIGGEPYRRLLEKIADRTSEAIKQDE